MESVSYSHNNNQRAGIFQRIRTGLAKIIEGRAQVGAGVSLTSEEAAKYFGGGSPTASGMTVNENTALTISTYFACTRNIADDTSKCPIVVGRKRADGSREVIDNHPISRLLNVAPNPEMCAKAFRETLIAHAVGWGNGYGEIQWGLNGIAGALWPLHPEGMQVGREGGRVRYRYRGREIPSDSIFHVPGLSFDGLTGCSPARIARESLGAVMATEQFGAHFFGNAAKPGGALEHPGKLSPQAYDRLKESIHDSHGGIENAGKTMILEEGMKWAQMTVPPEEAQFLLTRQFNVPEVCRWFRMPPHKVAHLLNATFSNIEHQSIEYVVDCLHGWFVRVEQEIQRKLLGGDPTMFARHNVNSLLRGDTKGRYEAYAIGRQWGWMSANSVLRLEDQDPIEGGDVYLSPINMQDARTIGQTPAADDPEDPEDPEPPAPPAPVDERSIPAGGLGQDERVAAIVGAISDAWIGSLDAFRRVERDKATRAIAKGPEEFRAFVERFLPVHRKHVEQWAEGALRTCATTLRIGIAELGEHEIGVKLAATRAAASFANEHIGRLEAADAPGWCDEQTDGAMIAARIRDILIAEMRATLQEV